MSSARQQFFWLARGASLGYNPGEQGALSTLDRRKKHMAYKISEACISCGACEAECPETAITEGETQFVIDPELCIDCGACADVCPVDAPAPE